MMQMNMPGPPGVPGPEEVLEREKTYTQHSMTRITDEERPKVLSLVEFRPVEGGRSFFYCPVYGHVYRPGQAPKPWTLQLDFWVDAEDAPTAWERFDAALAERVAGAEEWADSTFLRMALQGGGMPPGLNGPQ